MFKDLRFVGIGILLVGIFGLFHAGISHSVNGANFSQIFFSGGLTIEMMYFYEKLLDKRECTKRKRTIMVLTNTILTFIAFMLATGIAFDYFTGGFADLTHLW